MDGDRIDTDIWSWIRNMLHYTLYLEFELNGLAISFTTLDHRLELFKIVSTDNRKSRNLKRQ